jgi:hypothetical protein
MLTLVPHLKIARLVLQRPAVLLCAAPAFRLLPAGVLVLRE